MIHCMYCENWANDYISALEAGWSHLSPEEHTGRCPRCRDIGFRDSGLSAGDALPPSVSDWRAAADAAYELESNEWMASHSGDGNF